MKRVQARRATQGHSPVEASNVIPLKEAHA
jgi:hypothetical protein